MTTTAKIAAKGCNGTGITEDLAERLHDQLGRKVLAVVELVAEARSEKRNGDEAVTLSILTIEPAPIGIAEDHLRELQRSFHYERQLADGQLQIETASDLEPKVEDVVAARPGLLGHPFVTGMLGINDSEAGPVCDVAGCGKLEADRIHHMPATDPFATSDQGDAEEPEFDPYGDVHDFDQGPDDVCICGEPYESAIHGDEPEPDPDEDEPAATDERHLTSVE